MRSGVALMIVLAAVTLASLPGCYTYTPAGAPTPDTRCFVVYVHGRHSPDLSPGVASDADRAAYWQATPGNTNGDFVYASSRQADPSSACVPFVVGYDGTAAFVDPLAATIVALQIADFIQNENIQDGRIVLIGHSMGGLVLRWILNNPGLDPNYALVAQKTRYMITIATPHLGSPAADALFGMADTACANLVAGILEFIGEVSVDRAASSLRRAFLEEGSAAGGYMHDEDRTRRIYTVGTSGWNNGTRSGADANLSDAWSCLGEVSAMVAGDGVVTERSGDGIYERSGSNDGISWATGERIGGPMTPWLDIDLNHNHARYNDEAAHIHNNITHADMTMAIGDYIGMYGLDLE